MSRRLAAAVMIMVLLGTVVMVLWLSGEDASRLLYLALRRVVSALF